MSSQKIKFSPTTLWSNIFISNWFYLWVFPLAYKLMYSPVTKLKFYLRQTEAARFNGDKFEAAWNKEVETCKSTGKTPSVLRAVIATFGKNYALVGLYKFVWGIFTWLCAYYFLKVMLVFLEQSQRAQVGHYYALALFLCATFSSIAIHQLYGECNRISVQVKAALTVLIYRKSLKLSRVRGGAGEVVNVSLSLSHSDSFHRHYPNQRCDS